MELPDLSDPARLWWLLILPLLYLLARPPFPHRIVATAHMAQWLRAQERLGRRRIRFRRLRFLLLVCAFTLAVVAYAGPRLGELSGPIRLTVLLDASASMAAGTELASPWTEAVELVQDQLSVLPEHIEVRLARFGDGVEVFSESRAGIVAGLAMAPGGAGVVAPGELARDLRDPETAVWTFTDSLGPTRAPLIGALTIIGGPADNFGLVAADLQDRWPLPELLVQVEVASYASTDRQVVLAVAGPVQPVADVVLELAAGSRARRGFELRRTGPGLLRITLEAEGDALGLDNQVAWQLPGPPAPAIAVLADEESGPWIHAAARALAEESGGEVVDGATAAGFLLVEGGVMEMDPGRRRALYFGTRAADASLGPRSLWLQPVVVDWDRQDPLTSGMDLSDLRIDQALFGILPAGKALIMGDRGPLMVVVDGAARATIHTAFRMSDSNIGLLPAFPQLLRRSLSRAYGDPARPRALPMLLSAAESDLRGEETRPRDRALPVFGHSGTSLSVPLLVLALLALGIRVYT